MVDIREYYEDDSGEMKPGRKGTWNSTSELHYLIKLFSFVGISLSLDQWQKLKAAIPTVDERIDGSS